MKLISMFFLVTLVFGSASVLAQSRQEIVVGKIKMHIQYKRIDDPRKLLEASQITKDALKAECNNQICSAVPYGKFQTRVKKEIDALKVLEVDYVVFITR